MQELAETRSLVVRVWLPDRPGALGQVASRIGALRGDLTSIDILERGGGRVIDELVVTLPVAVTEPLLAREIGSVDGVAVEQIRVPRYEREDPAVALLDLAADVAAAPTGQRIGVLGRALLETLDADWAVVVDDDRSAHWVGTERPEQPWLLAFLEGSDHLDASGGHTPGDIVWARVGDGGTTVAAGRSARAFHERERIRMNRLAGVLEHLLR